MHPVLVHSVDKPDFKKNLYVHSQKMGASDITRVKMAETNGVFGFEAHSTDYGVIMSKKLKG